MVWRQFLSLSPNRSAIAINSTFSDDERQSHIAPEPLAPQPMMPIFILSEPAAKSLPELASIVAIETDADDLMKSRRDKFDNILLFMNKILS